MSVPRKLILVGLLAAAIALACVSGCTSDKANAVVELCGNLSVPEDIDAVRVVIYDQNRTPLRQGVRELWSCPGPALLSLPQTLEFEPVEGDVFIEVQGLKEGAPVMRSELRTTLGAETNQATVSLTRACMGARCAAGETCVQGKCELVALAARAVSSCSLGEPVGRSDASSDTGAASDAQTSDAGSDDTGSADAGSDDAGSDDTGNADAGSPTTRPGAYLCPEEDEDLPDSGSDQDADDTSVAADTSVTADTEEDSQ